jgi:hypothetical protein
MKSKEEIWKKNEKLHYELGMAGIGRFFEAIYDAMEEYASQAIENGWIEMGELCRMPENGERVLFYDSRHDAFDIDEYRGMAEDYWKTHWTHWIRFNNIPKPSNHEK